MKRQETDSKRDWKKDYADFLAVESQRPPVELSEAIHQTVVRDLHPSWSAVLGKLSLIHVFAGGLSLFICSQFGIGTGDLVMHAFMRFGANVCMLLCGALFMSVSMATASVLLRPGELRLVRRHGHAALLGLAALSLAVFFGFGAEVVAVFTLFWLAGAWAAGYAALQATSRLRLQ